MIKQILEKGDLQEGGKERDNKLESQFKDIATFVANRTVNPQTKLPYTVSFVEKAMKEIHFSVNPKKSAKKEALDVIKLLEKKYPIQRAKMRIKVTCALKEGAIVLESIRAQISSIEKENWENGFEIVSSEFSL